MLITINPHFCIKYAHAGFVVHRGRTIPTLASMQEPLPAARPRQSKERSDSRTEERGKNRDYFRKK